MLHGSKESIVVAEGCLLPQDGSCGYGFSTVTVVERTSSIITINVV